MTTPVFLADAGQLQHVATGDEVALGGAEGRHAAVVRRLRVGEGLVLTDGAGQVVDAVVAAVDRDHLVVSVRGSRLEPKPTPSLTVVQGIPKGERALLAVEQLVEVGVDRVVPWQAERCVTQWHADRGTKALQRWRSTSREAGKQARRWWAAEVADPFATAQVCSLLEGAALAVVLHEEAMTALSGVAIPDDGEVVLVVGPEGGISDQELTGFERVGAIAARLGPTVLRTSTAGAVAAGIVLASTARWR